MAAPVAPNLGTRIILNTRFIIAPPDTLYITNFILSMGYSICIPMMLVRLIMTMTGALRYSTGIESRYSVPQNIMVIGLARITSPKVMGRDRANTTFNDFNMTDLKPFKSPFYKI